MKFCRSATTMKFLAGMLVYLYAITSAAAANSGSDRRVPPLVLQSFDGAVLIGLSNTTDGAYHVWTYDLASDAFEVRVSGSHKSGRYPNLVSGVTPSRLVWNEAKYNEKGLVQRFESVMVEPGRGEPLAMDFIRTDPAVNATGMVVTSLGLFEEGQHLLVNQAGPPSMYWWWDLSTMTAPDSIPIGKNASPVLAAPATGIAKKHLVIGELLLSNSGGPNFRLVLLRTEPLKKIGALTTDLDVLGVFDGAPSECVVIAVRSSQHGVGFLRIARTDWEKGGGIDSASSVWLPGHGNVNLRWAADVAFWISDDSEGDGFVLNMAQYQAADTLKASIPLVKPAMPDSIPDYVVSADASTIVTCVGTDTFEVRSIALPEVSLTKRCRVESRTDGGITLKPLDF